MRYLAILLFVFSWSALATLNPKHFPVDEAMRIRVDFWKKVYTEISTNQGYLHDPDELSVIYETITHTNESGRARQRVVDRRRRELRAVLRSIAAKEKQGLNEEESLLLKKMGDPSIAAIWKMSKRIRYQRGLRDHYLEGLERSYRYLDYIREVIRREGLPEELAYLPHVESSFNYKAYSKVGAAGIWQFMRGTARQYNLIVNYLIDERRDPIAATVAATRYLKDNYRRLGTWPLALTAYNHGANSMLTAVRRVSSTNLSEIIERYETRSFGFASQNFYATFAATVELSQEPEKYFKKLQKEEPFKFSVMKLDRPLTVRQVAEATGVGEDDLRELNLALRPVVFRGERTLPKNYVLKLPQTSVAKLTDFEKNLAQVKVPSRRKQMQPAGVHQVQRGQNLYFISQLYKVPIADLIALNEIQNPNRILPGTKLKIPQEGDLEVLEKPPIAVVAKAEPAKPVPEVLKQAEATDEAEDSDEADENEQAVVESTEAVEEPMGTYGELPNRLAKLDGILNQAPAACEDKSGVAGPLVAQAEEPVRRVATEYYDLDVNKVRSNVYAITVEAEETLGHFAEWASVRTQAIRRLNRMRFDSPIRVGQRLLVPLKESKLVEFNSTRLEFHAAIEEDFFDSFRVKDVEDYVVRRGDSLNRIMDHFGIPFWLLRRYQPEPIRGLAAGQIIHIPRTESVVGETPEQVLDEETNGED
ncbi:MAG: LysM peptidoglycan-binding domain-containing protein [Bdellovibrionales bacterium]|nr:LysM peptidoglycan-binding domain-containing protein [Bdellovibrionales bacterium]